MSGLDSAASGAPDGSTNVGALKADLAHLAARYAEMETRYINAKNRGDELRREWLSERDYAIKVGNEASLFATALAAARRVIGCYEDIEYERPVEDFAGALNAYRKALESVEAL